MDRVTVEQAARILGIKEESVRKRVSRGKLRSDKDEEGKLLVYVDGTGTVRDEPGDRSVTDADAQPNLARELIEEMRDRISSLENQLAEARESRRRADTIIAQLTQANAALAQRVPELEAPADAAQEPRGSPESATEQPGRVEPQPSVEGAQEPATPRSWWRRLFGG
jgi:phage shock protein A